jgi:ribosomal protein S18 acetylase RimI-like enzyme
VASKYSIRPAAAADWPAIVKLWSRAQPNDPPVTVETLGWVVGRAIPDRPHPHLVAEIGGQIVGWVLWRGVPMLAPAVILLEVDPEHRSSEVRTALLDAVLAAAPGESEVVTDRSADDADALAFFAGHGFVEQARRYESTLDLTTFDSAPYQDLIATLTADGYRFSSLEEEDSDELRRALHRLNEAALQDVPTVERPQPTSFEQWSGDWLEAPHAIPATFALALRGRVPVGYSYVVSQSEGIGYMWMTAVAREHRGKRLGLAVKIHALRAAQARGLTEVQTNNDPDNAPMLAINRRLGFRDRPARVELKRILK